MHFLAVASFYLAIDSYYQTSLQFEMHNGIWGQVDANKYPARWQFCHSKSANFDHFCKLSTFSPVFTHLTHKTWYIIYQQSHSVLKMPELSQQKFYGKGWLFHTSVRKIVVVSWTVSQCLNTICLCKINLVKYGVATNPTPWLQCNHKVTWTFKG